MSDIFQEVEEDVRRERYEQIWKKYGNYIIAAAAVLVAAVAGYQAWQRYDLTQRQQVSDRFSQATQAAQSGNLPKAETDFAALTKEAPAGYATLAKFHLAGAYLDVFECEPLDPTSPIWDMPNVLISPHTASHSLGQNEAIFEIFLDNLARFRGGQKLRNDVDDLG